MRQVKSYWEYVADQVGQRYRTGMSPAEAAYDIALSDDYARQPFAGWKSPERIMTNAHTLYRHLQGRTGHPPVPEMINILRHQALVAHQLPDVQPAMMRK